MKIWTDKKGKPVSVKEFGKRFWSGVKETTPLQQITVQLWSMLPIFAGVVFGIVVTAIAKSYWLTLILAGSLPIQIMTVIGMFQKYAALKKVDDIMKNMEKEEENE